jgi:anthranilate 1,2-dioxygenase small subunit
MLKMEAGPELQWRVDQLLARYVLSIDEDQLEDWPKFFVDDCIYKLISKENADRGLPIAAIFCDTKKMLVDRVVSLRHANVYEKHTYRHILTSAVIEEMFENTATTVCNYVVYRTRTNGITEVYNAGTYRDKIILFEDELLFKEKLVTFDTNNIDALMATPI